MSILFREGLIGPVVLELGDEITGVLEVEKGIVALYSNGQLVLHDTDTEEAAVLDCLPSDDPVIVFSGSGGSVGDLFVTLSFGRIGQPGYQYPQQQHNSMFSIWIAQHAHVMSIE